MVKLIERFKMVLSCKQCHTRKSRTCSISEDSELCKPCADRVMNVSDQSKLGELTIADFRIWFRQDICPWIHTTIKSEIKEQLEPFKEEQSNSIKKQVDDSIKEQVDEAMKEKLETEVKEETEKQIKTFKEEFKEEMKKDLDDNIKKRILLLETEKAQAVEKIAVLTNIIKNMQKSINMIDMEERSTNIMISGVSEEVIESNNGQLTTDDEKVYHIMSLVNCTDVARDIENNSRIGREEQGRTRMLKVKLKSKESREKIVKSASMLRHKGEVWKKVFLKKDTHPVYVQETNRIRKKLKELSGEPANKDKVKLEDGRLLLDGKEVDRNLFFV